MLYGSSHRRELLSSHKEWNVDLQLRLAQNHVQCVDCIDQDTRFEIIGVRPRGTNHRSNVESIIPSQHNVTLQLAKK